MYLLYAYRKQKNQTEKKDKKIVVKRTKEIGKHCQKFPSFAKSWNESREEYKLIGEMISLWKAEKITQSQLATITGSKQQVIFRIKKKRAVLL